jgi:hypothetical protein
MKTQGGSNQMPGVMSDRDIMFLQQQAPQLANTVEGNRLVLSLMRQFSENSMALAAEADRYIRENGSMAGWREHKRRWIAEHPIDVSGLGAPAVDSFIPRPGGGR